MRLVTVHDKTYNMVVLDPRNWIITKATKQKNMEDHTSTTRKTTLLIINFFILAIGYCGGPMVMRLYFLRGGKRIWFTSWLETGGWPIILIPLLVAYTRRRNSSKIILMKPITFVLSAFIGILTGLDDYLYAYGVSKLPISTATLILASHLAFTALFAFILVKQTFTAYSVNAVMLLTVGAVVLGLHTGSDRPKGESGGEYLLGFFLTLSAAALYGFVLPLVEVTYKKAGRALSYTLVLEVQLIMCFFATAFCTVGMIINNDFQAIAREAKAYELGEAKYYLVVVFSAITWQCFFLGAIGIIYYSSSLVSGIMIAVLIPVTEVLAVIIYHEKFQPEKGVSLFLSLWGFVSYFYGEYQKNKKIKNTCAEDDRVVTEFTQQRDPEPRR